MERGREEERERREKERERREKERERKREREEREGERGRRGREREIGSLPKTKVRAGIRDLPGTNSRVARVASTVFE